MKVFVTGGTGFIGGHFLRAMADLPHEVHALRRKGRLPTIAIPEGVTWLEKEMDSVEGGDLRGMEALVHFASPGVSPKKAEWSQLLYWNVTALLKLLESARDAGVRRIIMAGTFAEYGRAGERFEFIPPNAPLEPTTPYAASKAAGFLIAQAFCIEHSLEFYYLRIFSAFGEGQHAENFWPALKQAALDGRDFEMTPGAQIRDYVAVEDVARAFIVALDSPNLSPNEAKVLNVGSGNPVTMRAFAEDWWKKWDAKGNLLVGALPYRAHEVMRYVPLISQ